jgi:Rrf2 family nitric oxide-sensitive transcriptional repressor
MRLTLFSDYTLRVLIYLGIKGGELATVGEIAEAYGISRNHLMKVVHHLATEGLVETVRGKGGGMRLAQAADAVVLGKVVRRTEASTALVECFDPATSECRIEGACNLQRFLGEALQAFYKVLDGYTLADLLRKRTRLRAILMPDLTGTARGGTRPAGRADPRR